MYDKQEWKDEIPDLSKPILDSTGKQKVDPQTGRPLWELVQEGTRITSTRLNHMEQGIHSAHEVIDTDKHQDITLQPGIQLVDAADTAPFRMGEIRGRTRINLLGRAGACESVSDFGAFQSKLTVDTSVKKSGIGSLKITSTTDELAQAYTHTSTNLIRGHFYLLRAFVYNENADKIKIYYGGTAQFASSSSKGKWEFIYKTYAPGVDVSSVTAAINVIATAADQVGYVDDIAMYEISESEYNAIMSMTAEQVAERYPYVDSMTNVTNPYAIATSGNLLPPFTEWEQGIATGDSCVITEKYAVTIDAQKVGGSFVRYYVPVSKSSVYTFTVESQGTNSLAYVYLCKSDKTRIDNVKLKGTITTTNETAWLEVVLNTLDSSGTTPVIGTAKYRNPMLIPGDKPQPFTSQSRSMWAAECQIAANPVDGSNADVLYVGGDGLPYVLEKWEKIALDGSLSWAAMGSYPGGMSVYVKNLQSTCRDTGYVTKYDGSVLERVLQNVPITKDDQQVITDATDQFPNAIIIAVSSKDSGWGDSYTPTADEIKAYFLGWRMYAWGSGTQEPWNNQQGAEKAWAYRDNSGSLAGGTRTLPTTQAPITATWQPYRLQFLKAKPTVEPVANYETGLTLNKGWNMVEVGSGVVIREKANPVNDGTKMNINNWSSSYEASRTRYRVGRYFSVYRNGTPDTWEYTDTITNQGYGGWIAQKQIADYDPAAVYHVTYTMLDPTLAAPISGSIAANLRGTVTDMVAWASDTERRLSVVETQKAEKDAPQWIKATLLNNWTNYDNTIYREASYRKDNEGRVYFDGLISSGSIIPGTTLLTLPVGYRPSKNKLVAVLCSDGNVSAVGSVAISNSGYVSANRIPHNSYLSLMDVTFSTD